MLLLTDESNIMVDTALKFLVLVLAQGLVERQLDAGHLPVDGVGLLSDERTERHHDEAGRRQDDRHVAARDVAVGLLRHAGPL